MRNYMIISRADAPYVDYTQVFEQAPDSLRTNNNMTKTFVKWTGSTPSSVNAIASKEGPYTYEEMCVILDTPEWNEIVPNIED